MSTGGLRLGMVLEQCLSPVPGGTGRYARELAAALVREAPAGAVVDVWTAWHRDVSAAGVPGAGGPRRLLLPRRPLTLAWEYGVGPRPSRADVLHAPTPLAPARGRRPQVVTVHDAVPYSHPETLTPRGVRWHRSAIERAARTADAVVVPTQAVADELVRHVRPERPLVVVGEGVSRALTLPADSVARAAALELPEGPFLLTLATIEPRKGLDVLLEAMADPRMADPRIADVPLFVVGQPGWGGIDVRARSADLGISGRVRLLGRLPDADLAVLLDRAALLVSPSRAEGFGLPVLEAMAAGVPVVSSDAPALVEVGGGATVTVPVGNAAALADALAGVLGDSALRRRLADAGRRRAADFTWEKAARQLWQVYEQVAAG